MTRKLCFDYVAHDMDWSVGHDFGNFVWGVGKGEPRGCAASGLGQDKILRVGFEVQDHAAGVILEKSGGVSAQVVEEHVGFQICVFGGGGLLGGYFIKGCLDAHINLGTVKEGSGYGINSMFTLFVKWGGLGDGIWDCFQTTLYT